MSCFCHSDYNINELKPSTKATTLFTPYFYKRSIMNQLGFLVNNKNKVKPSFEFDSSSKNDGFWNDTSKENWNSFFNFYSGNNTYFVVSLGLLYFPLLFQEINKNINEYLFRNNHDIYDDVYFYDNISKLHSLFQLDSSNNYKLYEYPCYVTTPLMYLHRNYNISVNSDYILKDSINELMSVENMFYNPLIPFEAYRLLINIDSKNLIQEQQTKIHNSLSDLELVDMNINTVNFIEETDKNKANFIGDLILKNNRNSSFDFESQFYVFSISEVVTFDTSNKVSLYPLMVGTFPLVSLSDTNVSISIPFDILFTRGIF